MTVRPLEVSTLKNRSWCPDLALFALRTPDSPRLWCFVNRNCTGMKPMAVRVALGLARIWLCREYGSPYQKLWKIPFTW